MNRSEAHKLASIQAPRSLLKQLIKTEKPFEETKIRLQEALHSKKNTAKERDLIAKALDNPQWDRVSKNVDPVVAKKVERIIEDKVNYAIKSGALPKPKLTNQEQERINQYYATQKLI